MPAFDIPKFDKGIDPGMLAGAVYSALASLEDQLNQRSQLHVNATGEIPNGTNPNADFLATIAKSGKMTLAIPQGKGVTRALNITDLGGPYQTPQPLHFVGLTTTTAVPSLTEFPNDGDWGFHNNTAGPPFLYLAYNLGGTVKFSPLDPVDPFVGTSFKGIISAAGGGLGGRPTVTNFPNNKDWGFFFDTGLNKLWLTYNKSATIFTVQLA